jgi:hypothetical protein
MPEYMQVGAHQFVKTKVVKMWANMMLVGWYGVHLHLSSPCTMFMQSDEGFQLPIVQKFMTCLSQAGIMRSSKLLAGSLASNSRQSTSGMALHVYLFLKIAWNAMYSLKYLTRGNSEIASRRQCMNKMRG